MEIDAVFSGGGMKAIAFLGAVEVMEKEGYSFKNIAGTSGGAIIGALLSAGYNAKELSEVLRNVNFKDFLDRRKARIPIPFIHWLSFYWRLGRYKGDSLEKWMRNLLKKRGIETFGDLEEGALKIIASDLTRGKMIILPDDLQGYGINPKTFSIAKAVRMSAGIPYFFEPIKIYDRLGVRSIVVDGALLSNFPIWLFNKEKVRPTIGFKLSPKLENIPPNIINNAIDMLPALVETMLVAHDSRYISKQIADQIIFIPVQTIKATEFNISSKEKELLIQEGRKKAEEFIQRFVNN
ncbi:patatin-like phospholipase family protein [Calidifontibacillus oryziterrae]|uniref:patatin-like phospholipase family protein n=1 Tax=Calidifontibacillus oryziterrae TaxID=1191699 RepID=UPI0002F09596|nr:patatin-like phospholipase family protein [Calidifontibacillus oryziterrae]